MSDIYLIPGIGADTRVFGKLNLQDHVIIHCNWLKPLRNHNLKTYAQTLINQYNIKNNSVIIGNSLGGMIAVEISKFIPVKQLILISSIKTANEAPGYFFIFRAIPIYRYLPLKAILAFGLACMNFFKLMPGQNVALFKSMIGNSNDKTMVWGMDAALNWNNLFRPPDVIHINGDHDPVFPLRKIKGAIVIRMGTHLMVYDRADDINKVLLKLLQ